MSGEIVPVGKKYETIKDLLGKMAGSLRAALPKHITADRMIQVALTSIRSNPKLLDCTRESLMRCVMESAQMGLVTDGVLGHAYLIPFANRKSGTTECTLIPGYKGLLKLARNSGEIKAVRVRAVHAKDKWTYRTGITEVLEHEPSEDQDKGPILRFWCVVELRDGGYQIEVMSKGEVDSIREKSRGKDGPAWTQSYEEMGKKTVLRRALKLCPASQELERAVSLSDGEDSDAPLENAAEFNIVAPAELPEPAKQVPASVLDAIPPAKETVPVQAPPPPAEPIKMPVIPTKKGKAAPPPVAATERDKYLGELRAKLTAICAEGERLGIEWDGISSGAIASKVEYLSTACATMEALKREGEAMLLNTTDAWVSFRDDALSQQRGEVEIETTPDPEADTEGAA